MFVEEWLKKLAYIICMYVYVCVHGYVFITFFGVTGV
jgi:hypothetical protein